MYICNGTGTFIFVDLIGERGYVICILIVLYQLIWHVFMIIGLFFLFNSELSVPVLHSFCSYKSSLFSKDINSSFPVFVTFFTVYNLSHGVLSHLQCFNIWYQLIHRVALDCFEFMNHIILFFQIRSHMQRIKEWDMKFKANF